MSMVPFQTKDYSDGRTKQSFKNSTDINRILAKAEKGSGISHLAKYEASYADFEAFDFQDAQNTLARADSIFNELSGELKQEFQQSPQKFFEFVNNADNVGQLARIFPELQAPGRQMPDVRQSAVKEPKEAIEAPPDPPTGGVVVESVQSAEGA